MAGGRVYSREGGLARSEAELRGLHSQAERGNEGSDIIPVPEEWRTVKSGFSTQPSTGENFGPKGRRSFQLQATPGVWRRPPQFALKGQRRAQAWIAAIELRCLFRANKIDGLLFPGRCSPRRTESRTGPSGRKR